MRALAIAALLAACSGPTPLADAGGIAPSDGGAAGVDAGPRPTTGLYRRPPPAAPAGPRRCSRGFDAFHIGELSLASSADVRLGPGAVLAREPVFTADWPSDVADSGLIYPERAEDPTLRVLAGPIRAAPFGSAFLLVSPSAGEVVLVDPLSRTPRLRVALDAPNVDVAVSAREGGALLAWGGLTYQSLDAVLEPIGEPLTVDVGAALERTHLVRTDLGVVAVAIAECGPVVHALDATGAPTDDPYCLDVAGTPIGDPGWDGARIVWTFDAGILELDGRGHPAAWTPAPEGMRPMAAFGGEQSVVVLRDADAANPRPGVVELERGTGALRGGLGAARSETSAATIANASVAVGEGRAWFAYRFEGSGRVGSVLVDCAAD